MSPADHQKSAPITFHGATPILRVSDLKASLNYYVGVLGFTMDWRDDDDGPSFASVSRGDCHLFLAAGEQGHWGSWMWIGVSDVDALHEELLGKGARVRHPPANYPWGSRELHLEDPDGNVLEKLSNVVDRLRELGGVLLRLSSSGLWCLLHAVDEAHAGAHER